MNECTLLSDVMMKGRHSFDIQIRFGVRRLDGFIFKNLEKQLTVPYHDL